jgi:hypothetical protein
VAFLNPMDKAKTGIKTVIHVIEEEEEDNSPGESYPIFL